MWTRRRKRQRRPSRVRARPWRWWVDAVIAVRQDGDGANSFVFYHNRVEEKKTHFVCQIFLQQFNPDFKNSLLSLDTPPCGDWLDLRGSWECAVSVNILSRTALCVCVCVLHAVTVTVKLPVKSRLRDQSLSPSSSSLAVVLLQHHDRTMHAWRRTFMHAFLFHFIFFRTSSLICWEFLGCVRRVSSLVFDFPCHLLISFFPSVVFVFVLFYL